MRRGVKNNKKNKRQCPACQTWVRGDNNQLVKHMSSNYSCRVKLVPCHGCGKQFANGQHLENHQKQQQQSGKYCFQGIKKLDHAQTLSMNSIFMNKTPSGSERLIAIEQSYSTLTNNNKPGGHLLTDDNFDTISKPTNGIPNSTSNTSVTAIPFPTHNSTNSSSRSSSNNSSSSSFVHRSVLTTKQPHDTSSAPTYDISSSFYTSSNKKPKIGNANNCTQNTFFGTTNTGIQYSRLDGMTHKEDEDEIDNNQFQNVDEDEYNQVFDLYNELEIMSSKSHDQPSSSSSSTSSPPNDTLLRNASTIITNDRVSMTNQHNIDPNNQLQQVNHDAMNIGVARVANPNNDALLVQNNNPQNAVAVGPQSQYILQRVQYNITHRQQNLFMYVDKALIDLYNKHRKARSPIGLFDQTIDWLKKYTPFLVTSGNHMSTSSSTASTNISLRSDIPKRKEFVRKMYRMVYGKDYEKIVRPKLLSIDIGNNRSILTTLFDFREVLIDMLSNDDIMNPHELVFFDHNDPTKIHPAHSTPVGEVATSYVFNRAHKRLCTNPNDVLWPLVMYSDEINFDKYGKLKLDPLSVSFGRLPMHLRNQAFAWRYFGIVHSIKYYDSNNTMDAAEKMKIYHKVLSRIFRSLKEIQQEGGIPFDLPMRDGTTRRVNLIIYVQFINGDTKGHDNLCGRMGSHNLGMAQHVRDCTVIPNDSDNIWMKCNFRKLDDVTSLNTDEEFHQISFRKVDNAMYDLEMGDEIHGIFGATNGEPLHLLQMQLLELISIVFTDSLFSRSLKILEKSIQRVVQSVERQSIKSEYLSVKAFREGLTKVKNLTGKERHARVFVLYLTLMSSDVVQTIADSPTKNDHRTLLGVAPIKKWFKLMEKSLILMEWLKKEMYTRSELYNTDWYNQWVINNNDNTLPPGDDDDMCWDSTAQKAMLRYLEQYKDTVVRNAGNELKIPKFHLMKHIVRNIVRNGAVINIDTSRLEAIAKELGKDPGLQTQRHHKTISFQTACRYHENITICEAQRLYYKRLTDSGINDHGYKYFKEKNDKEMALEVNGHNANEMNDQNQPITHAGKFQLMLVLHNQNNNVDQIVVRVVNATQSIRTRINDNLLYCIANWLWCDPIGGTLSRQSVPTFFTEFKVNSNRYRCHPSYRNESEWKDWVYVNWGQGYPEPIPAIVQIMISFDGCTIVTEQESHRINNIPNSNVTDAELLPANAREAHDEATTYLSKYKYWVVVQSCDEGGYFPNNNMPSENHFSSKIAKRFRLEENKFRIIPIEDIAGPALGMLNCCIDDIAFDNTAFVIDHPSTWEEHFIT